MTKTLLKGFVAFMFVLLLANMAVAQNTKVTFRVKMGKLWCEGKFRPDSSDIVRVAGNFNNWGSSTDTLRDVAPLDSIFEKQVVLNDTMVNQQLQYKFLKTVRGGSDWEAGDNHTYTVTTGTQTLPAVWFHLQDNDSICVNQVSGNVTWRVDMRAMIAIGWFVTATDTVQIRGGFNSWGGDPMAFNSLTGLYQKVLPFSGGSGDLVDHKFFMKLDTTAAKIRFPGYSDPNQRDGVQYDHPINRGDGNRQISLPPSSGNINSDPNWFSNINLKGCFLNATDTSRVTIRVNMGPATRYIDPFIPATDTLFLQWQDQAWAFSQVFNQGAPFPINIRMTRNGVTDSVWSATFKVKGKTHYGMLYNYRFVHTTGTAVSEGGGLGVQNPYRSRFIQPTAPNTFPATYIAPIDQWQKNAPMPAEVPPYIITGVNEDQGVTGIPVAYVLNQNYPNPFNPTTKIQYSIPENAKVSLKVFNVLGQQVDELVNQQQTKGNYVALFEGNRLASGVYFYRLEAGKVSLTKKMLLMK